MAQGGNTGPIQLFTRKRITVISGFNSNIDPGLYSFPSSRALAVLNGPILYILPCATERSFSAVKKQVRANRIALHPLRSWLCYYATVEKQSVPAAPATGAEAATVYGLIVVSNVETKERLAKVTMSCLPLYIRWVSNTRVVVADAAGTLSFVNLDDAVSSTGGVRREVRDMNPLFDIFEELLDTTVSEIASIDVDDGDTPRWVLISTRPARNTSASPERCADLTHQLHSFEKEASQLITGQCVHLCRTSDGLTLYLVRAMDGCIVLTTILVEPDLGASPHAEAMRHIRLNMPPDSVVTQVLPLPQTQLLVLLTMNSELVIVDTVAGGPGLQIYHKNPQPLMMLNTVSQKYSFAAFERDGVVSSLRFDPELVRNAPPPEEEPFTWVPPPETITTTASSSRRNSASSLGRRNSASSTRSDTSTQAQTLVPVSSAAPATPVAPVAPVALVAPAPAVPVATPVAPVAPAPVPAVPVAPVAAPVAAPIAPVEVAPVAVTPAAGPPPFPAQVQNTVPSFASAVSSPIQTRAAPVPSVPASFTPANDAVNVQPQVQAQSRQVQSASVEQAPQPIQGVPQHTVLETVENEARRKSMQTTEHLMLSQRKQSLPNIQTKSGHIDPMSTIESKRSVTSSMIIDSLPYPITPDCTSIAMEYFLQPCDVGRVRAGIRMAILETKELGPDDVVQEVESRVTDVLAAISDLRMLDAHESCALLAASAAARSRGPHYAVMRVANAGRMTPSKAMAHMLYRMTIASSASDWQQARPLSGTRSEASESSFTAFAKYAAMILRSENEDDMASSVLVHSGLEKRQPQPTTVANPLFTTSLRDLMQLAQMVSSGATDNSVTFALKLLSDYDTRYAGSSASREVDRATTIQQIVQHMLLGNSDTRGAKIFLEQALRDAPPYYSLRQLLSEISGPQQWTQPTPGNQINNSVSGTQDGTRGGVFGAQNDAATASTATPALPSVFKPQSQEEMFVRQLAMADSLAAWVIAFQQIGRARTHDVIHKVVAPSIQASKSPDAPTLWQNLDIYKCVASLIEALILSGWPDLVRAIAVSLLQQAQSKTGPPAWATPETKQELLLLYATTAILTGSEKSVRSVLENPDLADHFGMLCSQAINMGFAETVCQVLQDRGKEFDGIRSQVLALELYDIPSAIALAAASNDISATKTAMLAITAAVEENPYLATALHETFEAQAYTLVD